MHAKIVRGWQVVIPAPYLVEVVCSWSNAVLDGRIGLGDAQSDRVNKSPDVSRHCKWQHILRVPCRTNLEQPILERDF
jgi:hypothetical protein